MTARWLSRALLGALLVAGSLAAARGAMTSPLLRGPEIPFCDQEDRYGPVVETVALWDHGDGSALAAEWTRDGFQGFTTVWD